MSKPILAIAALLALGGCAFSPQYDPLVRDGTWQPMHVNRANLVASIAYPGDLVRGTGSTITDGIVAEAAIDRLHKGKVKKLPEAGLSDVSTHGQGGVGE